MTTTDNANDLDRSKHDTLRPIRSPASESRSPAAHPDWGWRSSASYWIAAHMSRSWRAVATPSIAYQQSMRTHTASSATCRENKTFTRWPCRSLAP